MSRAFYGWESLSDPIARVVITDADALDGAVTFIDRVTTESVPEPSGLLVLLGIPTVALIRRR